MLRNKKFTYILFPLVSILWVIIVYKITSNSSSDDNSIKGIEVVRNQSAITREIEKDYSPTLQNTNPFALEPEHIEQKMKKSNISRGKKSARIDIEYLGFTKRRQSVLANILYKSNYYILKERDSLDGYFIVDIQKDSIIIRSKSGNLNALKRKNI